jgi:hypothetical protein
MKFRLIAIFLIAVYLCLAAVPGQVAAQPARDWRFGVIEGYESAGDATAVGAAWTRVKIHWAITQAGGPGSWTPPVSDGQINGEIAAGRLVVGLLIGIPDWARDGNRLPTGLYLPHDDPGNSWAHFVRQATGRYTGRINHWIIWNEPDVWDAGAPGHTWDGTVEDFFQLHRTAYLVAKETNPNARIHLTGLTYHWDARYGREQYLNRLLRVISADPAAASHNYYFDALTAHFYFQPNQIYNQIQEFHGIRAAHGIPWKPIWLVETNAPPLDDPAWPVPNWTLSVKQNEQAAFMPQMMAVALAAGAERIAVYKLKDTAGDVAANPEPFGLVRMNGSRRPAFTTYQVATQYLAGMRGARRERWDEVGQVRLDQGAYSTTVLFARLPAPQQAQVAATANTAVLVDMWGTRRNITAVNGVFTVDLGGALCSQSIGDYCMIGGTTYYLVQAAGDGEAPPAPPAPPGNTTPAVTSPATISATTTPPATASATESGTPTVTRTPAPERTPSPTRTATAAASHTPPPTAIVTPLAPPATVVAQVSTAEMAVPEMGAPVDPVATLTPRPSGVPAAAADQSTYSYWFLGAALFLTVGLAGWWLANGRRQSRS